MTITDGLYIDALVIKGSTRSFSVSMEQLDETEQNFEPFNLSPYSIKFQVLGAAEADAEVLIEKIITGNTEAEEVGIIDNPEQGTFIFTITSEDTDKLGLGKFPVCIRLIDAETEEDVSILTEGSFEGEFNKLQIVQA